MSSSLPISISDDEPDHAGRRVRHRPKRKKPAPSGRHRRRLLRFVRRWWPGLLFVPALVLILYEFSRLRSVDVKNQEIVSKLSTRNRAIGPEVKYERVIKMASEEESVGNLNRLDRVTRVVGGVRRPCLEILSPERIQNIELPSTSVPSSLIKSVLYKTDSGVMQSGTNYTQSQDKGTRFNLFTGYQTLQEREEGFKVNETTEVHCGFYSENGGFRISDDDKNFLQSCELVVSTCAFGGGDDLYQPIGMTKTSLDKVCYVSFWDEITLAAQEEAGKVIDEDHKIGAWRIVVVKDLPFSDQRLNGKIPKMLPHRLFPQARYSIWVDSKSQFRRDPIGVFEALLWRTSSILAISEHGARSSLYDEAKAVVKKNKATPEEVEIQLNQYRKDGMPDDKRFNGKKALSEASVIVREHTPLTNLFMCLWFNEVVRFTSRDQLSFPYVLRRLNMPGINMFPVCTRKDLVNSLGHARKVKPLARVPR